MNSKVTLGRSLLAAVFAALTAVILNSALFYLFHAMGVITDSVIIQKGQPMTVVPVILSSVMPLFAGALIFWLLERFTKRGFFIFTILATVVLLASFTNPFAMIPNVPLSYALALNFMHLVVAGALWFFLRRETKRS